MKQLLMVLALSVNSPQRRKVNTLHLQHAPLFENIVLKFTVLKINVHPRRVTTPPAR